MYEQYRFMMCQYNIKLSLINYTLLGLTEHHSVFVESGHYVSYIRQSNKWYHCDDKHITQTNLLTLSNNVYFVYIVYRGLYCVSCQRDDKGT